MKRHGARPPLVAVAAALFCIVVAIGAGLQGRFSFAGPRWTPGQQLPPAVVQTQPPETPAPNATPITPTTSPAIVFSWVPILIVLAILVIAVITLVVLYWMRHRLVSSKKFIQVEAAFVDTADVTEVETDADLPTLHRGLLRAADALETDRQPRDAIIRAWLGLQEAAEDSGLRRRPSETPTEFTSRVFETVNADRAAAASLLRVYLRVRFRSTAATAADVEVARDAIERLRETWPVLGTK